MGFLLLSRVLGLIEMQLLEKGGHFPHDLEDKAIASSI